MGHREDTVGMSGLRTEQNCSTGKEGLETSLGEGMWNRVGGGDGGTDLRRILGGMEVQAWGLGVREAGSSLVTRSPMEGEDRLVPSARRPRREQRALRGWGS